MLKHIGRKGLRDGPLSH